MHNTFVGRFRDYVLMLMRFDIAVLLCSIFFFAPAQNLEANLNNREAAAPQETLKDESLISLNKAISENDILGRFKFHQKLLSFSYEKLKDIHGRARRLHLNGLVDVSERLLGKIERENTYPLEEDIIIGNVPLTSGSPFYEVHGKTLRITEFKPHAEYAYFPNLKLNYKRNDLFKKSEALWINPGWLKRKSGARGIGLADTLNTQQVFEPSSQVSAAWAYSLKDDNLTDYLVSLRQWIKRYEENSLFFRTYQGTVLMRNRCRIFSVDLLTGKELWSFQDPDNGNAEYYQTLKHPHQGEYGYQFILKKDTIFTELGGNLTAVKLKNAYTPKLLWKRALGEYFMCTAPIESRNILIAGVINARGELWISGFDCENGSLKWCTYIGTTSFLSPPCEISAIRDERVFLGTNHGILACLNLNDGKIIWLRKYNAKKYDLLKHWENNYHPNEDRIKFDTQFMEIEGGLLYYKPRESEYMYILNPEEGDLIEEVLVDSDGYYVLKAQDGKVIFLKKQYGNTEDSEIQVLELGSGKKIYAKRVRGGMLKGVIYSGKREVLFKINNTVHFLSMEGDIIIHNEIASPADGWLLDYSDGYLFIGEKKKLSCFNVSSTIPSIQNYFLRREYLENSMAIKEHLAEIVQLGVKDNRFLALRKKLLSELKDSGVSLNEIFPIIVNNREKISQSGWKELILELQKRYGQEIVTYRDIKMGFEAFLYESGLIDHLAARKNESLAKKYIGTVNYKNYQASGEKFLPLPIKVIAGSELSKLFLLLNRDQLLCVHENGDILWARKVFYCLYPYINKHIDYPTDRLSGRMYIDDIEAYLYNNTLIINDRINVVAVNINDGSYKWSLTNNGEIFDKEKRLPQKEANLDDRLFKNQGIQKSFLKNVMFYTEFINNRLVIVHGNKVYSVNPASGYCKAYAELNGMEGPVEVAASEGNVYILPYSLDSLKVLDQDLNLLGNFPLDFITDKEVCPELSFIGNYVILHINSELYILDRRSGRLKDRLELGDAGMHFEEAFNNDLLVIFPFKRIVSYRFADDAVTAKWAVELGSGDQNILWKEWERKSKYYFIINKHLLLPFREKGNYGMAFIDLETGRELWRGHTGGARGFFYDLSNYGEAGRKINFILTTGCEEIFQQESGFCSAADGMFVTSKICELNLANGETIIKEKRSIAAGRMISKNNIVETENYFVFVLHGKFLKAERKIKR